MDISDTTNSNYTEPITDQLSAEEPELSHTDKIIGVLSEPKSTFEKISRYPIKTIDWFLPIVLLLIVVALTNIILLSNPEIRMQAQEKQLEQMRQNFDEAVKKGQMTREQANQQMERIEDQMKSVGMGLQMGISSAFIFIFGFILFFIMAALYFVFAKFLLKGDGTYTSVLAVSGLVAYIGIIQIVIAAIMAMMFGRLINDTSLAAFINADRMTYGGWLAAKVDPLTIWANIVVSIGLAKMFKSNSIGKYFALVFGIWLIGGFLIFLIAKVVPFFRFFMGA